MFYASLADVLGKDPAATYNGGGYTQTRFHVHDLELDGVRGEALFDVENAYTGERDFHLTFIDACVVGNLVVTAHRCYRRGVPHSQMGSGRLVNFQMRFEKPVRTPTDTRIVVEELKRQNRSRLSLLNYRFTIGDEAVKGELFLIERQLY